MRYRHSLPLALVAALAACGDEDDRGTTPQPTPTATPTPSPTPSPTPAPTPPTTRVASTPIATLDSPWAMTFLPDGRMLVTEKVGRLRLVTDSGAVSTITGTPDVVATGQGGLLDVALDPDFATNRAIYLSYAERAGGGAAGAGLAVARGALTADATAVTGLSVIWRQAPKVADERHYGGRLAFAPDKTLYVTAGERHQGAPAQDLTGTLGKIVRINRDGSIPSDNPFRGTAGARPEIWSLGHRNPYGLVFASDGRLFESEMGPEGGDEFNLISKGANYGWRIVSEGNDGEVLPRHSARPAFTAPLVSWTPVIAAGGMIQYRGSRFVGWDGDFILAGLVSQGLVRVRVNGATATEQGRIALGRRIREVELASNGLIWVLEDGSSGRLLRLTPQ